MIATLVLAGFSLLCLLLILLFLVWLFQERIAFQPQRAPFPDATGVPRVDYPASDGNPLFAYLIGDARQTGKLLLSFHGNADLAIRQVAWAHEVLRRTGYSVMLTEYRGYMGLQGKPTYSGSRADSEAAWIFATKSLDVAPDRIAIFGHSLGTAIAAELSSRHRPRALLLQSPFTSAREMAALILGRSVAFAIWPLVSRIHFDTGAIVSQLDVPVSVCHGERDLVIPFRMGRTVFGFAKHKAAWLSVPAGSHSDVQIVGGAPYWAWIEQALGASSIIE